jgi:hypothetical protein
MKISSPIAFTCVIIALLVMAGCTQTAQPAPTPVPTALPTAVPTAVPTVEPTLATPVPTAIVTAVPIRNTIKDTPLLFTISAPEGYAGTTIRAITTDSQVIYKTTIFNPATIDTRSSEAVVNNNGNYSAIPDSVTIFSYSTSQSVDQNIRNFVRGSGAAFNESTVVYNGLTFTRLDVAGNPYAGTPDRTVIIMGNKAAANELGYFPVLFFTVTPDGSLNQATYDNMAESFRYYTAKKMNATAGKETDRPSFYQ